MNETPATSPFEAELGRLRELLLDMGGQAERLVHMALAGLSARDPRQAKAVRKADDEIDALEIEVDERVLEFLALQRPMAGDLRFVFVALKACNDIERVGDHAVNIAKACRRIIGHPPLPDIPEVWEMGRRVRRMLGSALNALANRDAAAARLIADEDEQVDSMRGSAFRIIISYMLEQPRYISPGLDTILVVQNLERIGDLATNIAEDVVFLLEGKSIKHAKLGDRDATEERTRNEENLPAGDSRQDVAAAGAETEAPRHSLDSRGEES